MAEETGSGGERTEAATPKRLQRAREEGNIPVSRELATLAALVAAAAVLMLDGAAGASALALRLSRFLAWADLSPLAGPAGVAAAVRDMAQALTPLLLAVGVAGAGAVLLQTGFIPRWQALQPDLARLSPRAGLRRLLGSDGWIELGKSLLRLGLGGAAVWLAVRPELRGLLLQPARDPHALGPAVLHALLRLLLSVLAVVAVLALADIALVRFRHAQQLRMSRQDIREEVKENEGDPQIKARVRQIRQQRARRRMLAAVPKATVVVTNPTHYAVALAYEQGRQAAPRVVAKGVDTVAARIREVASAHRVPLVSNPPLARALYQVPLDTEIPPEHFQAVAELIAYVWRLNQRVARG
jgi:flagellar biosynthesis protein FlhB